MLPRFITSFLSNLKDSTHAYPSSVRNPIGQQVLLGGSTLHHLRNVLRLKPGANLEIVDSDTGNSYLAKLISCSAKEAQASILSTLPSLELGQVTLLAGITKFAKCDLIAEKCFECGVTQIVFFNAERTPQKLAEPSKRIERWKRIAQSALKQSGYHSTPVISTSKNLDAALAALHQKQTGDTNPSEIIQHRLVFTPPPSPPVAPPPPDAPNMLEIYLAEGAGSARVDAKPTDNTKVLAVSITDTTEPRPKLEKNRRNVESYLVVGPEGGLTAEEFAVAEQYGYKRCSIGPKVLRSETAAIVACALAGLLTSYCFGT